jgi:hypothetical protein
MCRCQESQIQAKQINQDGQHDVTLPCRYNYRDCNHFMPVMLTHEQRLQYSHDGYIVIPDFKSLDEIARGASAKLHPV